jgi:flagellar biosynthesis/type III secretory pathway M-ring protein FliF/YscJ
MARIKKLTPAILKRMVLKERRKMLEVLETGEESVEKAATKTEEVPADDLADSIEQDINWIKALKIKENKLRKRLSRISEAKKKLRNRVIKKL